MVHNVQASPGKIKFTIMLTTPACPLKEMIRKDCEKAISRHFGAEVKPDIEMSSTVTTSRNVNSVLPEVKNIIAVSSGKGGVGKSTVASNLATSLSKSGAKVGLIDADIFGPSVPTMFNCEHERPNVRQENGQSLIIPIEQYGVKLMSIGFLAPPSGAVVWRGPMASSALKQFLSDTLWGELDYLLVDLPPGTSDIHLTLVQSVPVTGAIVVTTPQKVAISDAQKGISMFRQPQINVPVLGIVENMAYFTPKELPENQYFIFGKGGGAGLAKQHDISLLGQIPIVESIRESGDSGYPAVLKDGISAKAFENLSQNVARQVAIRNATIEKTKKVGITV